MHHPCLFERWVLLRFEDVVTTFLISTPRIEGCLRQKNVIIKVLERDGLHHRQVEGGVEIWPAGFGGAHSYPGLANGVADPLNREWTLVRHVSQSPLQPRRLLDYSSSNLDNGCMEQLPRR